MAMIEITSENARQYLLERGWIPAAAAVEIQPLGGGISNTVMMVRWSGDGFVFKQSLPKLRVQDDWPFDRERIFIERDCMALMGELLPEGSVPKVRFADDANYVFAMSIAPPGGILWKQSLLNGQIDPITAGRAGRLLAEWHMRSANDPRVRTRFAGQSVFLQGRVDPYHRTAAKVHPDLAPAIEAEVERMLRTQLALVHGDYSPKNIFVYPDHVLTLDFEVAHFGDPAFDAAFCISHLVLKAIKFSKWSARYLTAARAFFTAYAAHLPSRFDPDIEWTTIRELGCLLLARIDGKSKVEYITDEPTRDLARNIARQILLGDEVSLDRQLTRVEAQIAE